MIISYGCRRRICISFRTCTAHLRVDKRSRIITHHSLLLLFLLLFSALPWLLCLFGSTSREREREGRKKECFSIAAPLFLSLSLLFYFTHSQLLTPSGSSAHACVQLFRQEKEKSRLSSLRFSCSLHHKRPLETLV